MIKESSWSILLKYLSQKNVGDVFSRQELIKALDLRETTIDTYRRLLRTHLFIVKEKRGEYKIIRKIPEYMSLSDFSWLPTNNLGWLEYSYNKRVNNNA